MIQRRCVFECYRGNHPHGGLVLDSFHYVKGGSRLADLQEIPIEEVLNRYYHALDAVEIVRHGKESLERTLGKRTTRAAAKVGDQGK